MCHRRCSFRCQRSTITSVLSTRELSSGFAGALILVHRIAQLASVMKTRKRESDRERERQIIQNNNYKFRINNENLSLDIGIV